MFSCRFRALVVVLAALAAPTALAIRPAAAANDEKKDAVSAADYRSHVAYLASDELEGRGIGQPGIDKAAEYISAQFKKAGLEPGGADNSYFQPFDLRLWHKIGRNTRLTYSSAGGDPVTLKLNADFTPMQWSEAGEFDGKVVFAGYGIDHGDDGYDDYAHLNVKGKIVVMLRYEPKFMLDPDEPNTHTRHAQFRLKAERAIDRDAAAVIIVNPDDGKKDELYAFEHGAPGDFGIPMLHCTRDAASRLLKAGGLPDVKTLQAKIEKNRVPASAELKNVTLSGRVEISSDGPHVKNIIGIVRGSGPHADEFVIMGAHYDHLGFNRSMFRPNDPPAIHNGADDNASGSSGVIEAAKRVAAGPKPKRSIIFMTFTGEEEGLLGSQHWCRHPTVALDKCVAMINMDMIGRLRKNILEVGGMRTGDGFADMVKRDCKHYGFDLRDGGGGRGPSDHASFYAKNLPVLFLFTGLHKQYHQPTDDVDLINAEGGARITQMAVDMAYEIANASDRPTFHEDKRPEPLTNPDAEEEVAENDKPVHAEKPAAHAAKSAPRKLLGIHADPNDTAPSGVLVEDSIAGSAAARAGIDKGDRILSIDNKQIDDVDDIRTVMSHLKGDTARVVIEREGKRQTLTLSFSANAAKSKPSTDAHAKAQSKKKGAPSPHGQTDEEGREMPSARLGIAPSYGDSEGKEGYAIEYVVAGGPAAKAGMKDSDRILSIGGRKIKDINSYMSAMSHFKPGEVVTIVVLRDGKHVDLKAKLEGNKPKGNE